MSDNPGMTVYYCKSSPHTGCIGLNLYYLFLRYTIILLVYMCQCSCFYTPGLLAAHDTGQFPSLIIGWAWDSIVTVDLDVVEQSTILTCTLSSDNIGIHINADVGGTCRIYNCSIPPSASRSTVWSTHQDMC